MKVVLIIGLGGFVGAISRYGLSQLLGSLGLSFPIGTFVCNMVGCLIIGLMLGLALRFHSFSPELKMFVVTGFCGALTTFSTFSNESLSMLRSSDYTMFFFYVLVSVVLGLLATAGGYALSKV